MAPEPPSELIQFFEKYLRQGRNPFSLSYKLGSDLDYLIKKINVQLASIILDKLSKAVNGEDFNIPLPVLAQAISNLYSGLIMYWFDLPQSHSILQFTIDMHRMTRALLVEAVGKA